MVTFRLIDAKLNSSHIDGCWQFPARVPSCDFCCLKKKGCYVDPQTLTSTA